RAAAGSRPRPRTRGGSLYSEADPSPAAASGKPDSGAVRGARSSRAVPQSDPAVEDRRRRGRGCGEAGHVLEPRRLLAGDDRRAQQWVGERGVPTATGSPRREGGPEPAAGVGAPPPPPPPT